MSGSNISVIGASLTGPVSTGARQLGVTVCEGKGILDNNEKRFETQLEGMGQF